MTKSIHVAAADSEALSVAEAAFRGLQHGAATGDWAGFIDLLSDDVRVMIPVPPNLPNPPEGVLVGKDVAKRLFARHHANAVAAVCLECKRVAANGSLVVMEARVEGCLAGEIAANYFAFVFEIRDQKVASMYEYAIWTAKRQDSRWGDVAFAREAFPDTLIPLHQDLAV
jgi:ketosteroid isomerase-like protein